MRTITTISLLSILAACGSPGSKSPPSEPRVPTGPKAPGSSDEPSSGFKTPSASPVELEGFLFHYTATPESQSFALCEALCESFPPQCCGDSVQLDGLVGAALGDVYAHAAGAQATPLDVAWSDETVTCKGTVANGVMQVAELNGSPLTFPAQ